MEKNNFTHYEKTPTGDYFYADDVTYEAVEAEGKRTIVGYPIVWGAKTDKPIAGMQHRFSRGSVQFQQPTHALANHDYSAPLGDTDSGSLRMKEDIHGYRVEIDLPNTTAGNDTWELVKSGRVKGMSFGGTIQGTAVNEQGVLDVTKFAAHEVTVTPVPRFSATSISAKQPIQHSTEKLVEQNSAGEEKESLPNRKKEQYNRLNQLRLSHYRAGTVSAE